MAIREIIKNTFNIDLPITGGDGSNINDPIKFTEEAILHTPQEISHQVITLIMAYRKLGWELISQSLEENNECLIDAYYIKTVHVKDGTKTIAYEKLYFELMP